MKFFVMTFLFLGLTHFSPAQICCFGEGFIIRKSGDTLKCMVEFAVVYESKVGYKLTEGSTKRSELDISEIKVVKTPVYYFENIKIGKKERLMTLTVKGKANLYSYTIVGDLKTIPIAAKVDYVIKKDETLFELTKRNFKENMREIMGNCQIAVDKVDDRHFDYNDIYETVELYNKCN